jgi:hypothetical protein
MWLYYAFTAVALLFTHLLHHPTASDATLHLALISDIHDICADLARTSPAAARIRDITKQMDTVGFKLIKMESKKRALDRDDDAAEGRERDKRGRTELETTVDNGDPATREEQSQNVVGEAAMRDDNFVSHEELLDLPTDFNWEEWESWLQETSGHFSG